MRHRAFLSGVLAAVFAGCVSFAAGAADTKAPAKNTVPPPAAKAPAAAAPAIPQSPDDPAKVAAARNFIMAFHPQLDPKNVSVLIEKRLPFALKAAQKNDPKLDVKKFEDATRKRLMGMAMRSLDMQSHVVSRHFSLKELNDLNAFFRGPLGSKLANEIHKINFDMLVQRNRENPQKMTTVKIK